MEMITADRLKLDMPAVLEGIPDEPRKEHAQKVLLSAEATLREHERRRPIHDVLEENIRLLTRAEGALDRAAEADEGDGGLGSRLGSILDNVPPRLALALATGILTAATAAVTGTQVDWSALLDQEVPEAPSPAVEVIVGPTEVIVEEEP